MTPERWLEVERLFHEALERPPHERAAFLHDSSAGDDALRREVESLLDQSSRADAFLEGPAVGAAALLDAQRRSTLIGRRLSEYEVQEWIGAGGMGEVYRARDVKLGRDVAIKMLPAFLAGDPDRSERFKREAQDPRNAESPAHRSHLRARRERRHPRVSCWSSSKGRRSPIG